MVIFYHILNYFLCIDIFFAYKNFLRVSHRHNAAAAKSLQSCLTLCDPIDSSPPGSPFPGSLQSRTLEWVAISFSNAWKWKVKVKSLSRVRLFGTPWTAAYQAPPSVEVSRQEYWSGVPLPSPRINCVILNESGTIDWNRWILLEIMWIDKKIDVDVHIHGLLHIQIFSIFTEMM